MTRRRPPGTSTGSWIEQQIQAATEQGAFDDLPLAGQPLPHLEKPTGDYDRVAQVAAREGIDPATLLPPGLAMRKELEDLPALLDLLAEEERVRAILLEVNQRIRELLLMPPSGPPLRRGLLDVEAAVEGWRERRTGRDGCHGSATPPEPAPTRGAEPPHGIGATLRRWLSWCD